MTTPRVVVVTTAQRRVLGELTRDGASNRTIARRLHISEQTVRTHIKGLLAATGCPCRTALAVTCLRREVVVRIGSAPRRRRGDRPLHHGTWGGRAAHIARGQDPCDDCTQAWDDYVRDHLRPRMEHARVYRWPA